MYPLCRALEEITIGDWTGLSRVLKLVGIQRVCRGRFIRETFAPLLPVRRSESASRGEIGISSLPRRTDDARRNIIF